MSEHQALWDAAALAGAAASCLSTAARRHMLSAELTRWHSAPMAVQASLAAQAIVTGMIGVSLLVGAHDATQIETLLLVVSGVVSTALWRNLAGQERPADPPARPTRR